MAEKKRILGNNAPEEAAPEPEKPASVTPAYTYGSEEEVTPEPEEPAYTYGIEEAAPEPKKRSKKPLIIVLVVLLFIGVISSCMAENSSTPSSSTDTNQSEVVDGEENEEENNDEVITDYESSGITSQVSLRTEEFVAGLVDIEMFDFSLLMDQATSHIETFEMADGQISHFYLVQNSFEKNDIKHYMKARSYVIEGGDTVYVVYVNIDGECVYFDEETENWLMDIG